MGKSRSDSTIELYLFSFHGPGEDKQCSVLIGSTRSILLVVRSDCEGVLHMRFLSDGRERNEREICSYTIDEAAVWLSKDGATHSFFFSLAMHTY